MKQCTYPRRILPLALAGAMLLGGALTGCKTLEEEAVPVQSVSMILGLDLSGTNSYVGVVESKTTQKVARDSNKTVEECLVSVGDLVNAGDVLFTYDMDATQLSLESAQLEIDQLQNSITGYDTQIAQLEKEKKSASKSEQLSYTLQIQTAQKDQAEAQYNLKQKQAALTKLQEAASVTEVKAEISGVVQSISEDDATSYITILETDAYQVKGTATELNIGNLYSGETVTIHSRTTDETWSGTITEVNTGNTTGESDESNYNNGTSSSKYYFYVELDNSENMMMGQHIYITPSYGEEKDGLWLYSSYVDKTDDGDYVWAADSNNKLEHRSIKLGEYDTETDRYEVVSGLTADDYIAVPDESYSAGRPVTFYDASSLTSSDEGVSDEGSYEEGYEDGSGEATTYTEGEGVITEGAVG